MFTSNSNKSMICPHNKQIKCKSELPNEIWVEILSKLSIKPLHICNCVSKIWHSHVSAILKTRSPRGFELPPFGILFMVRVFSDGYDDENPEAKLVYLSLGTYGITRWLMADGTQSATLEHPNTDDLNGNGTGSGSGLLLGNLSFEFGSLISNAKKELIAWNVHRGLILNTVDSHTYEVCNPATKQAFFLPRSPSQVSKNQASHLVAIINFSDCLLSTETNFSVIRCYKELGKVSVWIEVYSSYKHEWFVSEIPLERAVYKEKWNVSGAVVLNNTLFFMTNKRHVVAIQLHSCHQQVSLYTLHLPRCISRGFCQSKLDVSQGCLYLSRPGISRLWIWKHDGISMDADAWIPQLIFKKSGVSLCQPVVLKFLRQIVSNLDMSPTSLIIHPEAPVVYICSRRKPSIYAIHLLNDTVEKVAELSEEEVPSVGYAYMYSPCFSSLKSQASYA